MEVEVDATIKQVETLPTGRWGVTALGLTFLLADGRTTEPTYVPGEWGIRDFFALFDAKTVQELVGARMRIVLADDASQRPTVTQLLRPLPIPGVFRRAFQDDERQA